MSEKLANCPVCGGECFSQVYRDFVDVKCYADGCPYSVQSPTKAQAIAHHERLAGRCRWEYINEQKQATKTSCESAVNLPFSGAYCPHCGKQIEVVKE